MLEPIFNSLGKMMPTCYRALDLVEKGAQRSLSIKERLALKYNSRLCMHCSCAEDRFKSAMEKMKEAQKARTKK